MRNIIQEMLQILQRQPFDADRTRAFGKRYNSLVFALSALDVWNKPAQASVRTELFRHFPCALVACIESYFRRCVRDLIDSGEPFHSNAAKLTKQRFTKTIIDLEEKQISVGHSTSHVVSLNNLDDIKHAMNTLTSEDFIARLNKTRPKAGRAGKLTLKQVQPKFYVVLEDLFGARHILCHEFGLSEQLTRDSVAAYLETTFYFVLGTEALVSELLASQTKKPAAVPSN